MKHVSVCQCVKNECSTAIFKTVSLASKVWHCMYVGFDFVENNKMYSLHLDYIDSIIPPPPSLSLSLSLSLSVCLCLSVCLSLKCKHVLVTQPVSSLPFLTQSEWKRFCDKVRHRFSTNSPKQPLLVHHHWRIDRSPQECCISPCLVSPLLNAHGWTDRQTARGMRTDTVLMPKLCSSCNINIRTAVSPAHQSTDVQQTTEYND